MKRTRLPELEDLSWFPHALRRWQLDHLHHFLHHSAVYAAAVDRLDDALRRSNATHVLDLCSGGGGAVPWVIDAINAKRSTAQGKDVDARPVQATLSDLYPNLPAFERLAGHHEGIDFERAPIDATRVDATQTGFRTIFTGFHHLPPAAAEAVLTDAARAGRGLAVFEFTRRAWHQAALGTFVAPLQMLLDTPKLRPRSVWRYLWTYVLPVLPLTYAFDSTVSHLRSYTPGELEAMAERANTAARAAGHPGLVWRVETERHAKLPLTITSLIGLPDAAAQAQPGSVEARRAAA